MSKIRIDYIDVMRGITMILVVYCHVSVNAAKFSPSSAELSYINAVVSKIHMPLFFFISGYFVYGANYNFQLFIQRSRNRLVRQLYPTTVVWIVFCLLYREMRFTLLLAPYKQGYWFTLVAVEMFFLLTPIIICLSLNRISQRLQNVILIIYGVILTIGFHMAFLSDYTWSQISSCGLISFHLPYFMMGILYKLNSDKLKPVFCHKYMALVAFIAFTIMFIFAFFIKRQRAHLTTEYLMNGDFRILLLAFILGALGIIFVHYLIYKVFSIDSITKTKISVTLRYIGSMTLEIYLFHYFFMREIVERIFSHCIWLVQCYNTPLEFPVYVIISFFVIGLCLTTVYIMKRIRIYPVIFLSIEKKL